MTGPQPFEDGFGSGTLVRGISTANLKPNAKEALRSAGWIREYLPLIDSHSRLETYETVVDVLTSPARSGVDEIPSMATVKMNSSIAQIDLGNGMVLGTSNIDHVRKYGNKIRIFENNGAEYTIEIGDLPPAKNINVIGTLKGSKDFSFTFENADSSDDKRLNKLLSEVTSFMMDGACVASSITKDQAERESWPTLPDDNSQDLYSQRLKESFGSILKKIGPNSRPEPQKRTEGLKPLDGFDPVVGAALANMETQLKSLGHPELMSGFIEFIRDNGLESQIAGIWIELQNLNRTRSNELNNREVYANLGESGFNEIFRAKCRLLGSPDGTFKNVPEDKIPELKGWREKTMAIHSALRGTLKAINLIDFYNKPWSEINEQIDRVTAGEYDGLALLINSDQASLVRRSGELGFKLRNAGPYLPDDFNKLKNHLS